MAEEFVLAGAGFAALLGLIALRCPIGLAMLLVGAAGYVHIIDTERLMAWLKTTPFFLFANYTLSVIPLFILMGALAERGGLATRPVRGRERARRPPARRAGDGA